MAADLQSFLQVVINLFLLDILDLGLYWQWWWWVQLSVNWGTISHLTERWTLGKDSSWLKGWEKGKLLELANFLFNSITSKKKPLNLMTISTLCHHHPYDNSGSWAKWCSPRGNHPGQLWDVWRQRYLSDIPVASYFGQVSIKFMVVMIIVV